MSYRVGIYRRLSKEDAKKGRLESESIENQLMICRNYIESHEELEEVAVYTDDGYTGLNYEREGFQQMMRDVESGKINTIITKSLSRLGREHAETIRLFKKDFVDKRVRYIAISDNIDFYGMIENVDIPLKVILNDLSSMETSKNVRSAFRAKKKRGDFTGAFAPYGYKKNPGNHNQLIPDEEAAEVVRYIFRSYVGGMGIAEICLRLNEKGILPPAEYKNSKGYPYTQVNHKIQSVWVYPTVRAMLSNETYIGNVVQNKENKLAYNSEKKIRVPKQEWLIAEGMHEALISEEVYQLAQRILKERWQKKGAGEREVTKYRGLLKCKDCGRSMSKAKRATGLVFRCGTYARYGTKLCSSHWIAEDMLDMLVLGELNKIICGCMGVEQLLALKQKCLCKVKQQEEKQEKRYKAGLKKLETKKRRMILAFSEGVLTAEDFRVFKENYEIEKHALEEKICSLQSNLSDDKIYQKEFIERMDDFIKNMLIRELTREVLVAFVSEIGFWEKGAELKVVIQFRFQKPLRMCREK